MIIPSLSTPETLAEHMDLVAWLISQRRINVLYQAKLLTGGLWEVRQNTIYLDWSRHDDVAHLTRSLKSAALQLKSIGAL